MFFNIFFNRQEDLGNQHTIHLDGTTVRYALTRSHRRSIGFKIDNEGLHVCAPHYATTKIIEEAILSKQHWIINKLDDYQNKPYTPPTKTIWEDGSQLAYLGKPLTLKIWPARTRRTHLDIITQELHLHLPEQTTQKQLKTYLIKWLQAQAKRLFVERLAYYASKLGEDNYTTALTSAKTQWGSCTTARKIRLNWRLIHFNLPLIDYIIAHELSHLQEMNHSPRFWQRVESVYPDFKAAKKQLHQAAQTLPDLS